MLPKAPLPPTRRPSAILRGGGMLLVVLSCWKLSVMQLVNDSEEGAAEEAGRLMQTNLVNASSMVFLNHLQPNNKPQCQRGDAGTWVRNWTYPQENHFVRNDSLYVALYVPTEEAPFRWEESWAWQDECSPLTIMNSRDNFCNLMHSLDISRIFFGGDSITGLHYATLLSLLRVEFKYSRFFHDVVTIDCPGNDVKVLFGRFDRDPFQLLPDKTSFVSSNNKKTLLILNIGAHFGQVSGGRLPAYRNHTHLLLHDWLSAYSKASDIVYYVSSVPGHTNCLPNFQHSNATWNKGFQVRPYSNYDEWKVDFEYYYNSTNDTSIEMCGWHYFDAFNEYTKEYIISGRREIHYLNTFNMTILRPDGHNGNNGFFSDCLHYITPGPVDWWVHLLYSSLLDLI